MQRNFTVTYLINREQWSHFVINHPEGNIFQTPEMYNVYKRTKNYEPIAIAVLDESGQILALTLAFIMKEFESPLGIFTARAIMQGGPLWVNNDEGKEAVRILMLNYDKIMKRKAIYTQIRNIWEISKINDLFNEIDYKYEDHLNYLIDLKMTEEDLWASLSKSRKRGIRHAIKNNITVEEMNEKKMIPILYEIFEETHKRIRVPPVDISIFYAVYDILYHKNMAKFFLVKHNNEYIGGRIVLLYKKSVYAWYRGSKPEFMNLYPNDLIGWDTIERFHKYGYHILDLGGAGKPGVKYGVRDFKKQFGGQLVNYGRFKKSYHPYIMNLSSKIFEIYRTVKN